MFTDENQVEPGMNPAPDAPAEPMPEGEPTPEGEEPAA